MKKLTENSKTWNPRSNFNYCVDGDINCDNEKLSEGDSGEGDYGSECQADGFGGEISNETFGGYFIDLSNFNHHVACFYLVEYSILIYIHLDEMVKDNLI